MLPQPLLEALAFYLQQLETNPLKTKCITCCFLATTGNMLSQYLSGKRSIDKDSLIAYGLFGFLFGGPIPHWFFLLLENVVPRGSSNVHLKRILMERLLFMPAFQALGLYMLTIFEGKSHKEAQRNVKRMFVSVVKANWLYLTVPQLLNIIYVPPMLKSVANSLIAFCWIVYLAKKRSQAQEQARSKQS
ncbi:peroxisomal membrane protein 2 [Bacillus rossius redtenbacheri]|uniref:peroxisomal membrane protein 2 n=1 Tax=Bacillus rossius redtenbacheri TaxID=93214 RepID=UPI002FDC93A5